MKKKNVLIDLVVIDPQNDFMDLNKSALPVSGANADMDRLASFIRKHGHRLNDIHVTLDTHQEVAIFHPIWWKDKKGNPPPAMITLITADDIKAGIWTTRNPNDLARSLAYVESLEKNKKNQLVIWNPHCIVGTPGHNLQENLSNALREWSKKEHANIDFVTKGTNPYTEHYGALRAEVDDPTDPGSQLNTDLLETLAESDIILVTGEAFSHCVKETMDQIVENIGQEHLKKIRMMTDCTSSIGAIPNGPNFPEITKAWLKEIQKKGVGVTTSTTFFN